MKATREQKLLLLIGVGVALGIALRNLAIGLAIGAGLATAFWWRNNEKKD